MNTFFFLVQFWLLLFVSFTLGDNIKARRLNATLPTPTAGMAVYYNGESDFIYLVSGIDDGYNYLESILQFDISNEEIERIGSLPLGQGSVFTPHATDSLGNLVYFSTSYPPFQIHKFNIVNSSVKTIGDIGSVIPYAAATIKNSAGNVLVLGGGFKTDVHKYNFDSENVQSEVVGQVGVEFLGTFAVKIGNNTALVFGTQAAVPYVELDLETLETDSVAADSFPEFESGMTVTYDNKYVYLFGGSFAPDGKATNGVIRLDPITHSWDFLEVEVDPPTPENYIRRYTEVIWVEKLNRIYMFGGSLTLDSTSKYTDDIYSIDLDQISPPPSPPTTPTTTPTTTTTITTEEPTTTTLHPYIFSCIDRADGIYPHPEDCSRYLSCRNGTFECVHTCPPPLLYDPTIENCNLPSLVNCDLSCVNKADGTYPHPYDCSLYLICYLEYGMVAWCLPGYFFDPNEGYCVPADLVQCEHY